MQRQRGACGGPPLDLSVLHGDGTNTVAKKGQDVMDFSGLHKGERVIAGIDNKGNVRASLPVAPGHIADTVLFPEGWQALQRVAKLVSRTYPLQRV